MKKSDHVNKKILVTKTSMPKYLITPYGDWRRMKEMVK